METTLNTTSTVTTRASWKWIYKLGAVAAVTALLANLLDVLLGFGSTEMVTYGTKSAIEWFALYNENWFRGVYALGILNIVYMIAMLPVYFALFGAHFDQHALGAGLTIFIFLAAMSMYISNNAAIPLLVLSSKYSLANTDMQRTALVSAGEAILSRGEDFTAGSFIPLFLGGVAAICISLIMLRGGIFGKVNAWIGIVGFTFLSLFTIVATFIPALYQVAFYFLASIGGILALTWFALVARRLFQLGRNE
ncbi:MAG TPA: hypothetical protein VK249_26565 [Anaerolineales bacterium]|nr:hypothetical protein [Anaerolineales bacterium]